MLRRVLGLTFAALITLGFWYAYENYGQFANVARWTGDRELRWLRPWLTEFRMPILGVTAFLFLTWLSWLWSKLKLGH